MLGKKKQPTNTSNTKSATNDINSNNSNNNNNNNENDNSVDDDFMQMDYSSHMGSRILRAEKRKQHQQKQQQQQQQEIEESERKGSSSSANKKRKRSLSGKTPSSTAAPKSTSKTPSKMSASVSKSYETAGAFKEDSPSLNTASAKGRGGGGGGEGGGVGGVGGVGGGLNGLVGNLELEDDEEDERLCPSCNKSLKGLDLQVRLEFLPLKPPMSHACSKILFLKKKKKTGISISCEPMSRRRVSG
jgi:hypothetical protein